MMCDDRKKIRLRRKAEIEDSTIVIMKKLDRKEQSLFADVYIQI